MDRSRKMNPAYWTCAGFTLLSALVSVGFSVLALRMSGGQEYALYAASRSVALPLGVLYAMWARSRSGLTALAIVMIVVQTIDGVIGFYAGQPAKAYGPIVFAIINLAVLFWMNSQTQPKRA